MIGIGAGGPLGPVGSVSAEDPGPDDRTRRSGGGSLSRIDERNALAVLVSVDGLGPATLGRLILRAGSARAVIEVALSRTGERRLGDLARDGGGNGRALEAGLASRIVAAAVDRRGILERIESAQVRVVTFDDPLYPDRLRAIELPPHVLFVRGDPDALAAERSVAVVGTRRPTAAGREIAARIGVALVRAGACVVSGLAVGVDGAAHEAVVGAGGRTVAVLGSGHARLYPAMHHRLAAAIVGSGGAVISEFAPDVVASRGTFPRRNRLISGLSEATIVVEAPVRSGALTTAAWALEQGRGCFLVPGALDAPMSAGCLAFLREAGTEARIVAGLPELLDDLGLAADPRLPAPASSRAGTFVARGASREAVLTNLDATPRRIAEALVTGSTTVDDLVAATDLPVAAVLSALTRLEAADLVRGAYGRYSVAGGLVR